MNFQKYDHVVEVSKHDKRTWVKNFLEYSLEHIDFIQEMAEKNIKYYICEKTNKLFLLDSNNNEIEINYINISNFQEVEIDGHVYRKYRTLK